MCHVSVEPTVYVVVYTCVVVYTYRMSLHVEVGADMDTQSHITDNTPKTDCQSTALKEWMFYEADLYNIYLAQVEESGLDIYDHDEEF